MRQYNIKTTLLVVTGCAFLFLVLTQALPFFINSGPLVEKVNAQVQQITGENFVHGNVSVSILTGGKIIFDGVAVRNPPEATKNYFMRADRLILHVGLLDVLFGNTPHVKEIELISPSVELEHFDEGHNNWSFLFQGDAVVQAVQGVEIKVIQGEVVYTDHSQDYTSKLQGISGTFGISSGQLSLDMQAIVENAQMTVNGVCQFAEFKNLGSFDTSCVTSLTHPTMNMEIEGRLMAKYGGIISKQTIKADSNDVRIWGDFLFGRGTRPFSDFYANPLPMKFTAESYSDADESVLNVDVFNSGQTDGKGTISIKKKDGKPFITSNFWFANLNYDQLALGIQESVGSTNDPFKLKDGFDTTANGEVTLHADKVRFHEAELNNVNMTGQISNGALIVNEAKADAPEKGNILTLGRITAGPEGLSYDGLVEAYGDSLRALSPMFGISQDNLPADVLGQFRTRFNIIVRARSTTLSELRLVVGDRIEIAGGINIYGEAVPRLNATVAIRNIDMTPFEKLWLKDASLLTPPQQQPDSAFRFKWLKGLNRHIQMQVEMDQFTLFGLKGAPSSMQMEIQNNELSLRNIDLNLNGSRIQGVAKMTQPEAAERPFVESQLTISRIDLGDTFLPTMWASRQPASSGYQLPNLQDTVWAREPINFFPLHYFDGMAELRIRQMNHEKFTANNIKAIVKVNDYQLTVKEATMNLWGGDMKMDITVDSEVVPGLNVSFYMLNAQLRDLLASFVDYKNVSGLVSASGRMGFSGLNFDSWIDSINGHLALDARNIFIQEFNLPAIIRSISSLRSVSGLLNAIRLSFDSGATRIGSVNGTTYFSRGAMTTTRVTFRSNESVGTIEGKVNIRRWMIEMAANFGLITMAQTGYPFLIVNFEGPFEMPTRNLNTKSIEAFLAQKLR